MSPHPRVRVYIACSLDGFIAGPDDDLSWLPGSDGAAPVEPGPGALSWEAFMAGVGALLMGRRTHDVMQGFDAPWPYGERPVLVATSRPLESPVATVRPVQGDIRSLIAQARQAAGDKDVYVDGGALIRQALDAVLVDDLVVTVAPVVIGRGVPLFAGVTARHALELVGHYDYGTGMVQVHYSVR